MVERKYSVLMSVYYKEKPEYLETSINSMLQQTLRPDEIVIVKDGKLTNELEQVLSKFVKQEPGLFKIVSLKENVGLGKALDIGLQYCRNELIARMDTDDISLPERCEMQVDMFIKNPQLSLIGTMMDEFFDEPNNIVSSRVVPTEHKDIVKRIKRRNPFNHPTVMFKKSEVLKCGGYGGIRKRQDYDLFSRMINRGCLAANIDKSLLLFRSNEDNFRRRKSWEYCKGYISVQYAIWRRGHCSFIDFLVVTVGQIIILLMDRVNPL